jgi:hypothetical protein
LKLQYDETLSSFAIIFDLRRYIMANGTASIYLNVIAAEVGQRSLTVSKPALKLGSAYGFSS